MKNKLLTTTATIIAALLMVSCADRSHDSFIEDINGGKTTVTPTPAPKPQPTPVPTPQPKPKPVKPKGKVLLKVREYQEFETYREFQMPESGTYRAEFSDGEVQATIKFEENRITVQTLTDLNTVSNSVRDRYKRTNIEALNIFNYTNEEHAKAGRDIKISSLRVAHGSPEDPGVTGGFTLYGTYTENGQYKYVWFHMTTYHYYEKTIFFRKPDRYRDYDEHDQAHLYRIK
jgi:lipoprotein